MNLRDIVVLIGLLAVLGAGAALVFGFGAEAAQAPESFDDAITGSGEDAADPEDFEPDRPLTIEVDDGRSDDLDDPNAPRPTVGAIEGRVSIATSLLDDVETFHVRVTELAGSIAGSEKAPFDRIWPPFEIPKNYTPRFRLEEIPFSNYGYRVELLAKHCNGSSQIIQVNADQPYATVSLALTRPSMFTLRVKDQYHNPHVDWSFELRPVGEPAGRSMVRGTTNAFGTILFESLVQGSYVVVHDGREIGEIQVQTHATPRAGYPIEVQSATLTVPIGRDLRVEIFGPAGVGLAEVDLELQKTDTIRNERWNAVTDFGGVHTFEHLAPGKYQLNIFARGFQRTNRSVMIREDATLDPLQVRLAPTR